jgi:hypothetical protein
VSSIRLVVHAFFPRLVGFVSWDRPDCGARRLPSAPIRIRRS